MRHLRHVWDVPCNPEGLGDGKDSGIQALCSGTLRIYLGMSSVIPVRLVRWDIAIDNGSCGQWETRASNPGSLGCEGQ